MTTWRASLGEILDLDADALICSANPQLNLSGGVGGEILRRYGASMQEFLHDQLRQRNQKFVPPGTVMTSPPCGSRFRVVLHAVAIDAFYETSAEVIRQTYQVAFALASQAGCRTVAATCLACGYGRATPATFAEAIRGFLREPIPGIDRVEFRSTNRELVDTIDRLLV